MPVVCRTCRLAMIGSTSLVPLWTVGKVATLVARLQNRLRARLERRLGSGLCGAQALSFQSRLNQVFLNRLSTDSDESVVVLLYI